MSNSFSRSAASREVCTLAGENLSVLLVDLGWSVVYFSDVSVQRPGNLTPSGSASLVLFIRPCTARCLWLQHYFFDRVINTLKISQGVFEPLFLQSKEVQSEVPASCLSGWSRVIDSDFLEMLGLCGAGSVCLKPILFCFFWLQKE